MRNFNYWGKPDGNVDEVVFTPIGNDATRVAALLSGEIDVMEPVPLQDVERIKAAGGFNVLQGPELRTIFLGMDQKRDELLFSNVKGKNPFKDVRVRRAFYQAIDEETIKSRVMRGAASPTAEMVGAAVRGFQPDMNKRLPYDPEAAKKLLAEAGYPNGFEVGDELPQRPLRQRRRDLPGGRRQPRAGRRQGQPDGRDQGHLLPEDPAPRHQLLPARLDAEHGRRARRPVSRSWRRRTRRARASSISAPTATRSSTS